MIVRCLSGIVAGLVISVVLYEALMTGAGVYISNDGRSALLIGEVTSERGTTVILVLIHALAVGLGAAMATALAGPSCGGLCGLLWLAPIFLIGSLSPMSDLLWGSLAIACLVGTLFGMRLALLVDQPRSSRP